MKDEYSVVIVGGGITGLSAAYHLLQKGVTDVAILDPFDPISTSLVTPGFSSGGFFDNFTRLSHVHGKKEAAALWLFGNRAFSHLRDFCSLNAVDFCLNDRVRIISSISELAESKQAVEEMNSVGITQLFLSSSKSRPNLSRFNGKNFGFQIEENGAAFVSTTLLLETLRSEVLKRGGSILKLRATAIDTSSNKIKIIAKPQSVSESSLEIGLKSNPISKISSDINRPLSNLIQKDRTLIQKCDSDGVEIRAEITVLANHLEMWSLVPFLQKCLIPYSDQWSQFKFNSNEIDKTGTSTGIETSGTADKSDIGICYSANHGYEWGVIESNESVRQGGSRYLNKNAGIGIEKPCFSQLIEANTFKKAKEIFGASDLVAETSKPKKFGLGCRPCDEIPLIGPMFGEDRILVSTGYMGHGISFGLYGGSCVADLIEKGNCDELPRILWPERLRSWSK